MFFLLCGFLFVVTMQSYLSAFLGGLSLGLCALNRPIAYLWGIVLIGHILAARDSDVRPRRRAALGILGLLGPLLLLKFIFHWSGGGQPLFALNLAVRVGDPKLAIQSPVAFAFQHLGAMSRKFLYEMARFWVYLFQFGSITLFSALSVFSLFLPVRPSQRDARNVTIALVFTTAAALSFLTVGDASVGPLRYFDVFTPVLVPWGVTALLALFPPTGARKYLIFGLVGVYLAGAAFQAIRDPFARAHSSEKEVFKDLANLVPDKEIVAAKGDVNVPSIVWYGDRRTVLIDGDIESSLTQLRERGIPIDWYFGRESDEIPRGFSEVREWPGGFVLYRKSLYHP
jgi:hypothetical protein